MRSKSRTNHRLFVKVKIVMRGLSLKVGLLLKEQFDLHRNILILILYSFPRRLIPVSYASVV